MADASKYAFLDKSQYLTAAKVVPRYLAVMRPVVRTYSELIQQHIINGMREPKSGRTYIRPGRIHVASAPGESPAVDYGKLVADIKTRYLDAGLTGEIGTRGTPYGEFLERGTERMFPRPFVDPARAAYEQRFIDTIRAAVASV